jgi:hypothetical protein
MDWINATPMKPRSLCSKLSKSEECDSLTFLQNFGPAFSEKGMTILNIALRKRIQDDAFKLTEELKA